MTIDRILRMPFGRTGRMLGVVALLVAVAAPARAGVIFDGGPPNQLNGNEMTAWLQADSFTLSSASVLTDVQFWSLEIAGAYQGSISWFVYADSAGAPGTELFSGITASVTRTPGSTGVLGIYDEYVNDFSVGSVALAAGNYWLGLHNGPMTTTSRLEFYWETTSSGTGPTGQELVAPFTGSWSGNNLKHAFVLYGNPSTVPEPTTLGSALLALGALGGARLVRRRGV